MKNFKNKEYYNILGISPDATKDEIKSAYRQLARKYHPDVNPGNKFSEIQFKQVGEAYEILVDDESRKKYDLFHGFSKTKTSQNTNKQSEFQAHKAYSEKTKTKTEQSKENTNTNSQSDKKDKSFNDIFSEVLDGLFHKVPNPPPEDKYVKAEKRSSFRPQTEKGSDVTADITLTITEAHNGTVRTVNVLHSEICPKCRSKKFYNGAKCTTCNGKGELSQHKKLSVKIPPNVHEGSKIRVMNEGNKGINGGENGDLFLIVHIQKNSIFTFEDLNVSCEIPITPSEAALGAEIEVPVIDGFVNLKIPPETHSGQKFRLAGQGLTDSKTNKVGDHIVLIKIELPKNLTPREIELYKELSVSRNFNPRDNILYR